MLPPWLIPETNKSGSRSSTSLIANLTQSTGVPVQLYTVTPGSSHSTLYLMGISEVIALDMPERGPSGAMTTSSPKSLRALINSWIPFALNPSSFVININGLLFLSIFCVCLSIDKDTRSL